MTGDTPRFCPSCGDNVLNVSVTSITRCEICGNLENWLRCDSCKFCSKKCLNCDLNSPKVRQIREYTNAGNDTGDVGGIQSWWPYGVIVIAAIVLYFIYNLSGTSGTLNVDVLKLKKNYPLQKNETWYHFLSVLEKKVPSVKSVIFLHGEDKRTSRCLIHELVSLFSSGKIVNFKDITFSNLKYEVKDYGLVLEHYLPIVKKYRVLITDLNEVSGNTARIFHSLCDETSSDIKPSLFIFTLKYSGRTENLKPMERAAAVLRETWYDLPQSEMFPLFSRVIKHVIDVVPEEKVSC